MNQESALEMPSVESLREPMGLQVGSPGVGGACKHVNSPSSSPLSPPPPQTWIYQPASKTATQSGAEVIHTSTDSLGPQGP